MSNSAELRRLVDKLWSYCDVLRDAGVSAIDYVEQLSFLLFLKMADERAKNRINAAQLLPESLDISWDRFAKLDGVALEEEYRRILAELGKETTNLGVIFRKAQNRVQEPALLRKLVVDLIGSETWSSFGGDLNGDAYEGLLQKSASDVKSGAGQYFTPRTLIHAMIEVMRPTPADTIVDPACGTAAHSAAGELHRQRELTQLTVTELDQIHCQLAAADAARTGGQAAVSPRRELDEAAQLRALTFGSARRTGRGVRRPDARPRPIPGMERQHHEPGRPREHDQDR